VPRVPSKRHPDSPDLIFWCQRSVKTTPGARVNPGQPHLGAPKPTRADFLVPRVPSKQHPEPESIPVSPILGHQSPFVGATDRVKTTPGPTRAHFLVPRVPSKRHQEPGSIPVSPILPIFWCQRFRQNDTGSQGQSRSAQSCQFSDAKGPIKTTPGPTRVHFLVPKTPSKRHPEPQPIPASPIFLAPRVPSKRHTHHSQSRSVNS